MSIQSCSKDDAAAGPQPNSNTNTEENNNTGTDSGTEDDDGSITIYKVEGDKIVKEKDYKVTGKLLEFQKDTKKHQEIWNLVKRIIPANYRSRMSEFVIFAGEKDGTAGYVVERTRDLSKWQMGIAIDFAYQGGFNTRGELAYTIVHEFGHIITLDKVQVDSSVSQGGCKSFFTGEGCSRDNSNINKLYQNHWADIWEEFRKVNNENDAQKFYDKYKERYVTQYASTNPGEDIAEVFAMFVTTANGVHGNSRAEQKIQQMYDNPEMINLRNYIRGNIAKSSRSFLPAPGSWKNANTFGNKDKMHCGRHNKH
ncbi:hypothetical protein [Aquimarina sp. MAR_2010_214]|uniref:hypothetical protein n=1 Tax=Aquimarina sp. MAR_2010_214 TaxID=1250026 RepID=UPI000C70AACD|nr:hypothetical protein [Aquimarina sp. MAR_2010_214]